MRVRYRKGVEDKDQLHDRLVVPKHIMAKLVDYFFFNSDHKVKFGADGEMVEIEGVPKEIFNFVNSVVQVTEETKQYEVTVTFTREGRSISEVEDAMVHLLEQGGINDGLVLAHEQDGRFL